jgi:hypothetical protein
MPNKSCIYSIILNISLNNIHLICVIPFYLFIFQNFLTKKIKLIVINPVFIYTTQDLTFIITRLTTLLFREGNYKNSLSRFLIVFSVYFILEAYFHTLVPYQVLFYIWFFIIVDLDIGGKSTHLDNYNIYFLLLVWIGVPLAHYIF